jgi:hypothetical protein
MPDIHFNYASGSDTQASGAPYDMTPVYGTGASTTDGSINVDLSTDSPDLSGVPTDGSAVLWVDATAGQKWSIITAVDNTTKIVTVTSGRDYDVTETGRSWAIGGKRKTLDADQRLYSGDWYGGWSIVLEDDQTITTTPTLYFTQTETIKSDIPGTRRTIAQSTSGIATLDVFPSTKDTAVLIDLKLTNTNATKTTGTAGLTRNSSGSGATVTLFNCEIGDETDQLYYGISTGSIAIGCYIHHCISYGTQGSIDNTVVSNNGTGIYQTNSAFYAADSFICDNTGDGIAFENQYANSARVVNCTIANNGGDGVGYSAGSGGGSGGHYVNNSITGNGTYGVGYAAGTATFINNNFGSGASANGSGAINGTPATEQGSTFSDPLYLDPDNGDYRIPSNSPNANAASSDISGVSYRKSIGAADVVQDAGGPTGLYYLTTFSDYSDLKHLGDGSIYGGGYSDITNADAVVNEVGAGSWTQHSGTRWIMGGSRAETPPRSYTSVGSAGYYASQTGLSNISGFDSKISDYRMTVSLYGYSTNNHTGVIFRHDTASQSYFLLYNLGVSGLKLYYYDGTSTANTLIANIGSYVTNRYYNVYEIECVGDSIKTYREGTLIHSRTDTNNMTATGVGLYDGNVYSGGSCSLLALHKPGTPLSDYMTLETVGRQPSIPHPLYLS